MKKRPRLLIVDDEPNIRKILQAAFERAGSVAVTAESAEEALQRVREEHFDLVLTDVFMPGMNGVDLLRAVKAERPDLPVLIMTAFGTIPQAVEAIRAGASDYVTKPFDLDQLKKAVAFWIRSSASKSSAKPQQVAPDPLEDFVAESRQMKQVMELVRHVADTRTTVLITGESGTGKEVVAKALHRCSSRAKGPFVAVSCAALPETLLESELFGHERGAFTGADAQRLGRFELANGGTLFLDEIGEVPPSIQVKLLRVLQEREFERLGGTQPIKVDVRLIAATNKNLDDAVDEGSFRQDLLFRLKVLQIDLAPLRERTEDIEPLALHFLRKFAASSGSVMHMIDPEVLARMTHYSWPGNVRELENVIERAVTLAPKDAKVLRKDLLPPNLLAAAA